MKLVSVAAAQEDRARVVKGSLTGAFEHLQLMCEGLNKQHILFLALSLMKARLGLSFVGKSMFLDSVSLCIELCCNSGSFQIN